MNFQYCIKSIIRKSKIINKYWANRYQKVLKNNRKIQLINIINQLNLYERKNILSPKINRVIWIDLKDLNYYYSYPKTKKPMTFNSFHNEFIRTGNWDKNRILLFPHYLNLRDEIGAIGFRTMWQLFYEKKPWSETDEYKVKSKKYEKKKLNKLKSSYYNIFNRIKEQGYKSQKELGKSLRGRKVFDEIRIAIDRDGKFGYICSGGNHRLAIAKILKIKKIPVVVDGIHRDFLDLDNDILGEINLKLSSISVKY